MVSDRISSDVRRQYVKMQSEPSTTPQSADSATASPLATPSPLFARSLEQQPWIFDELPKATIVSVTRPDTSEIGPIFLSYTIEIHYKEFKWQLVKKASQVLYLHLALKKRAFIEEIHERQEQVREWLQNLGLWEHSAAVLGVLVDDETDDVHVSSPQEESSSGRKRDIPTSAALPIIRPALSRQQSTSDRAKAAMQGYLNHFLGDLDIVNSREVCRFLEVSRLSFCAEYGTKLKEDYVTVKHLPKIRKESNHISCFPCHCFSCCNGSWQKVWAVLKPGFLAFLEDPFEPKLLDIIVFDVLPLLDGNGVGRGPLAKETKERNPLRYGFQVSCGNRTVKLRTRSHQKVNDWVTAINNAGLRPPEGCSHRFSSFAPPRGLTEDDSHVQWFIDGQAAFEAIASSIEEAKSEIFMTGWWVCPELFLRRPFHVHESSKLEAMLEEKAKQGVQIYVLLYKEVSIALKINSVYSKRRLLDIHENVKVLRYPDHFSTGVYLWSHHEKIVIVDNQICYIGGLDLCFGRYDNFEHKVADFPPLIWPGKDYYNPRESEPNSWEDTMKDELDRRKYPRMPWHDVQCALKGPPCRDVARHFVQRWNYAKRNKAPNEQAIPLLMPQHHMVIPHYIGKSKEIDPEDKEKNVKYKDIKKLDSFPSHPSHDIPLLLPQEPDGMSSYHANAKVNGPDIHITLSNSSRTSSGQSFSFRKAREEHPVQDMQLKGFVDNLGSPKAQREQNFDVIAQTSIQNVEKEWWEDQERVSQVVSTDEARQVGPCTSCRCQIIRSVDQWSAGTSQTEESIHIAYISLIEKAEHFIYIENQFFISGLSGDETIKNRVLEALFKRIMQAEKEKKTFRVIIVIPLLPGFQGGIDDGGAASVRALMHWQYRTICRGPNSIFHSLYDIMGSKADDFISFYGLRTYGRLYDGRLYDGGPLITNQIYVHSKLMIIDDRMALIGSANINDRSLLGSRDSEIGVVIEDKEFVDSFMNGKPWRAGKFSLSLRLSLWLEHLGLHAVEIEQIRDPVNDATYKDLWMETAKANSKIYEDVFSCVPNDLIHSRATIRFYANFWKEKLGYTTIDLGVAPEKLESSEDGEVKTTDPMERLKSVRGHLVTFPMHFMMKEDLRPFLFESEFYATSQVFH